MKSEFFYLGVIIFVLGLTSCKKKYECHCEGPGGAHEHFEIKAKDKAKASSECDKKESSTLTSCEIE